MEKLFTKKELKLVSDLVAAAIVDGKGKKILKLIKDK